MCDLSIIIVTYNSEKFISLCLDSIYSQSEGLNIDVVVYDNHSKDMTKNLIKKYYKKVVLIESKNNDGFAKANNLGVGEAKSDNILILNPDTRIPQGELVKIIIAFKNNKGKKLILVPQQLDYESKEFLHCGLGMDFLGFPINEGRNKRFFYADGAAIMIRKEHFLALGGFDEEMFLIHEDVDLSWKARILGFKFLRLNNVSIQHHRGYSIDSNVRNKSVDSPGIFSTSTFRRYYGERNNLRNILKNYSFIMLVFVLPLFLLISLSESLFFLFKGNLTTFKAYFRAYYWNIQNIKSTLKRRRFIQNKRVSSDLDVMRSMYPGLGKLRLLIQIKGIPKVI